MFFKRWKNRTGTRIETVQHQIIEIVSIRKFVRERTDKGKFREVFQRFQSFPLTQSQVAAAVSHYKETLVVAGAGSGKTSLLLGRAKYLVDSNRAVAPNILTLAFNKDAASELESRAKSLDLDIVAQTFHGFGNAILKDEDRGTGVAFGDQGTVSKFLKTEFERIEDSPAGLTIAKYFSQELVPFKQHEEFENLSEYAAFIRSSIPITLSDDRVKSHGEWLIANYLFCQGIEFQYEKLFDKKGFPRNKHKPDFTITGKSEIYIEYFGIDGSGSTAPWIDEGNYHSSMEWKRNVHTQCGTKLISVTYQDLKDGVLLKKVETELRKSQVQFNPRTPKEILSRSNEVGYTSRFVRLCETFLQHSRAQRFTSNDLQVLAGTNERTRTFVDIFGKLYSAYEQRLVELGLPDFADLIHKSADLLESGLAEFPFTHVMVDEYQDISKDRQRLIDAMRVANPEVELTLVGDDWQSINRFAGSDLSIMRQASKPKLDRKVVPLGETHRFPQSLANYSSKFIQENPAQLRKEITSQSQVSSLDTLFLHWNTQLDENLENLKQVISIIGSGNNEESDLMVIARYSNNLPTQAQVEKLWKGPVTIKTIHSSKGMEADYVIVMDVQQDNRGFPSTIEDDPVIKLVLPDSERFEHAEERRIFYVALTRARVACHLITPVQAPSLFALELNEKGVGINLGLDPSLNVMCPICKSGRIVKSKKNDGCYCSNYPLCKMRTPPCGVCGQSTNLMSLNPLIYSCKDHPGESFNLCPSCDWGVLLWRDGKYGAFQSCHTWPITRCKGVSRR